ncbi:hypothetical protein [Planococcus sp. CAU13]|uniref:hypothetical protein n=1 Tax=Planococcus sp. CAU13 TaxID=1541197 RepID=UPI00126A5085|nr:hypothetical protein [Planococcus sp. CAU13]
MKNFMISQKRDECILIFLDADSYSPSTIQRGAKLADAFGCPFHVSYGISSLEQEDNADEVNFMLTESKKMSIYFGAESFSMCTYDSNRGFEAAFEEVKTKLQITQLVLTGTIESRWQEIFHGSTVNYFLKKYPDMELHIVSQRLAFPYEEWNYERGKKSSLQKTQDGYSLTYHAKEGIEGLFFKEKTTDFETGIFLSATENEIKVFDIYDGNVINERTEFYKSLKDK